MVNDDINAENRMHKLECKISVAKLLLRDRRPMKPKRRKQPALLKTKYWTV